MLISDINTATLPLSVVRIEVEQLFGRYTYTLTNQNQSHSDSSLIILYGDNGSGKTTILKLLFHLLSASQKRNHRQFLLNTPFARFSVFLADGTHIAAIRENGNLIGSFKFEFSRTGKSFTDYIKTDILDASSDDIFDASSDISSLKSEVNTFQELPIFRLNLFFLGDDRILENSIFESVNDTTEMKKPLNYQSVKQLISQSYIYNFYNSNGIEEKNSINRELLLKQSIEQTEEWIREQALKGSDVGTANAHSLYEEIIARIINSDESLKEEFQHSANKLMEELKAQESRSNDFSRFGLMSPLSTQKLVQMIQSAPEITHPIILDVLKPYLDSVKARMDALQDIQDLLTLFVNTINEIFFRDKQIRLHIQDGISIVTEEGIELAPELLSSGEKQLLLLFCNTLTARDKATIFIIDEPELSLNIKWQRQLIRALLDLTKGSQVQFILATHSFELLSQYRSNVVKLENQGH